jgi:hypothetical protein
MMQNCNEKPTQAGGTAQSGSVQMTRLVIDLVLFSCMFAFVTGIVIAAANLLI